MTSPPIGLPFGGPGGPVNIVQFSELVVGANHPAGITDVTNRPIAQIMVASGVDPTTLATNFIGFSLVGHQHHASDIVGLPSGGGGGGTSSSNGIGVVATKQLLFSMVGGNGSPVFNLVLEDNQIWYWNGTQWIPQIDRYSNVANALAYGAIGNGTPTFITASDISNHNGIWLGSYTVNDTWDFVGIQEAIYAAFGGPSNSNAQTNVLLNRPLRIPSGLYTINRPLSLNMVEGGIIYGDGKFATIIRSTFVQSNSTTCLQANGFAFMEMYDLQFQQSASTPNPTGNLVSIGWDGSAGGGLQGNIFRDMMFSGEGQFPSTDPTFPNQMNVQFGLLISPSGSQQGSENLYINCHHQWCEYGASTRNFNALQNGWYGGNFENCRLAGIWAFEGAIRVDNVGFQNDPNGPNGSNARAGQQIAYGGWDILITNSSGDASLITNCRSQSYQFVQSNNDHKTTIIGCNVQPFVNRWTAGLVAIQGDYIQGSVAGGVLDGTIWKCTVGGTAGGSEPNWQANTSNTLTDGSITWVRQFNNVVQGDRSTTCLQSILPYGLITAATVVDCVVSRPDYFNPSSAIFFTNNTIVAVSGNLQTSGVSVGIQGHTTAMVLPSSSLLAFSTIGTVFFSAVNQFVGFDFGDFTNRIIGMYGTLGAHTPIGVDKPGQDTIISGGLSTGAGVPGDLRLQITAPGPSGSNVNSPYDVLKLNNNGIFIGESGQNVLRNLQIDYVFAPGTITNGSGFIQSSSFYGVLPGDIVEAAYTGAAGIPPGCIFQTSVTAPDKVQTSIINGSGSTQVFPAARIRYAVLTRPPVTGVTGQSAASDIAQFQIDMGTASVFQCMYDTRVNVTLSGSNVTAFDDIAGSGGGKGPTLSPSGVDPVFVAGSINLIQSTGNSPLVSASNAAFDISGTKTILFGFSFNDNSSGQQVFKIVDGSGDSIIVSIGNSGSGQPPYFPVFVYTKITSIGINYNAPTSSQLRAGYISLTASTMSVTLFDAGTATVSVPNAYPAGNNTLSIFPVVAGNPLISVVSHFAVIGAALTSDQINIYRSWVIAKHNSITV